jgi:hypothetical protein
MAKLGRCDEKGVYYHLFEAIRTFTLWKPHLSRSKLITVTIAIKKSHTILYTQ